MAKKRPSLRRRNACGRHALRVHECPRCGRVIRGNAWYGHQKACRRKHGGERPLEM